MNTIILKIIFLSYLLKFYKIRGEKRFLKKVFERYEVRLNIYIFVLYIH